jgi:hypothetical protein
LEPVKPGNKYDEEGDDDLVREIHDNVTKPKVSRAIGAR